MYERNTASGFIVNATLEHIDRINQAFALRNAGVPQAHIAEMLEVTPKTIEGYFTIGTATRMPPAQEYNERKFSRAAEREHLATINLFTHPAAPKILDSAVKHMDEAIGVDAITMAQKAAIDKVEGITRIDTMVAAVLASEVEEGRGQHNSSNAALSELNDV